RGLAEVLGSTENLHPLSPVQVAVVDQDPIGPAIVAVNEEALRVHAAPSAGAGRAVSTGATGRAAVTKAADGSRSSRPVRRIRRLLGAAVARSQEHCAHHD